jgi:hypothetical protein
MKSSGDGAAAVPQWVGATIDGNTLPGGRASSAAHPGSLPIAMGQQGAKFAEGKTPDNRAPWRADFRGSGREAITIT